MTKKKEKKKSSPAAGLSPCPSRWRKNASSFQRVRSLFPRFFRCGAQPGGCSSSRWGWEARSVTSRDGEGSRRCCFVDDGCCFPDDGNESKTKRFLQGVIRRRFPLLHSLSFSFRCAFSSSSLSPTHPSSRRPRSRGQGPGSACRKSPPRRPPSLL